MTWKSIPNHPNFKVNDTGEIKSKRGIRKPTLRTGYKSILIYVNGGRKSPKYVNYTIHRLVAQLFIPNPDNKPEVNHKDGNKFNNSVENLEWCTREENRSHAHLNGLEIAGEKHGMAKLTYKQVKEIREKYIPRKYSQRKLAREYNVDQQVIWSVIHRKTWNIDL